MSHHHLALIIDAIGWALVHSIWQGAVIGLLFLLVLTAAPSKPLLRYRVAMAGLFMVALSFVCTVIYGLIPAPLEVVPATEVGLPDLVVRVRFTIPVAVWALGVAALSLREVALYVVASSWRRTGVGSLPESWSEPVARLTARVGLAQPPPVLVSEKVPVPLVLGAFRPVVLLPKHVLETLLPEQIESILAHEFAHVRRLDPLVNALQTVIDVVLFFHPAVWWLSATVRKEREHCCDDVANAACGNPVTYAKALVELAALPRPLAGVASTGGDLTERVRRIVGLDPTRPSRPLASLIAAGMLGLVVANWVAQAATPTEAALWVTQARERRDDGDRAGALELYEQIWALEEEHPYRDHALGHMLAIRFGMLDDLMDEDPSTEVLQLMQGVSETYPQYALPEELEAYLGVVDQVRAHPFGLPGQAAGADTAAWYEEHELAMAYRGGVALVNYGHFEEGRPLLEAVASGDPADPTTAYAAGVLINSFLTEGDLEQTLARSLYFTEQPVADAAYRERFQQIAEGASFELAQRLPDGDPAAAAEAWAAFSADFPQSKYLPLARYNEAYYAAQAGEDERPLFEAFVRDFPDHEYAESLRARLAHR